MKSFVLLLTAFLISGCGSIADSIDSDAEAIDMYCEGFNFPLRNGAQELRRTAIAYLENSEEPLAQEFVTLTELAARNDGNTEALLLLADICKDRN